MEFNIKSVIIVLCICFITVVMGVLFFASDEKGEISDHYYVNRVKSFGLITTVAYHADVFEGEIQGNKVVYAYESFVDLGYDLNEISVVEGDSIILPKCKISIDQHLKKHEYIVGSERKTLGSVSETEQKELRARIDQQITESIYAKGYVERAYETAKNMLEKFLSDCNRRDVVICPNPEDVKLLDSLRIQQNSKFAQYN